MADTELLRLEMYNEASPEDFLGEVGYWQKEANGLKTNFDKDALGHTVCQMLIGKSNFHGSRKVILDSDIAFLFRPLETGKSTRVQTLTFRDFTGIGYLGDLSYARQGANPLFIIPLYDATALKTQEVAIEELFEEEVDVSTCIPSDKPSRAPIHIPVQFINYALCAA